jgi:type IV fimbrial biogenesis protein FimT
MAHGIGIRAQRGITLIENLVALCVAAVLTAAAIPAIGQHYARHQVANISNELVAAVRQARSEALSRRARVAVAPLALRDWNSGWEVFVDENNNGRRDAAEPLLQRFAAPPRGVRIAAAFGATFGGEYLSFDESGYPQRAGSDGLLLGRLGITGEGHARSLCVSAATVRLKNGTSCA